MGTSTHVWLHCDYLDCDRMESADFEGFDTAADAREEGRGLGWRRRKFTNTSGIVRTVDLCEDHADVEVLPR